MRQNKMTGRIIIWVMVAILLPAITLQAEIKGPQQPSNKDKCPVCGMFVYKYPDWTAQIIFKDGAVAFFDGCKDLFKFYLNLNKYKPGKKIDDIAAIYVTEYYDMKSIPAADSYFVVGSGIYGPMGHELIPLAAKKDAETFKIDHNGKGILRFEEITRKVIDGLD